MTSTVDTKKLRNDLLKLGTAVSRTATKAMGAVVKDGKAVSMAFDEVENLATAFNEQGTITIAGTRTSSEFEEILATLTVAVAEDLHDAIKKELKGVLSG